MGGKEAGAMSDYPLGPDYEYEEDRYCRWCKRTCPGVVQCFGSQEWFLCDVCEGDTEVAAR